METFTGYTKAVTADEAAARFAAKHGYPPAFIEDGGTVWLVGPIRNEDRDGAGNGRRPGDLMRAATAVSRPMTPGQALQLALMEV